jgi:hypothetical protein
MKKLTLLVAAAIGIVAVAALWKRNRRSMHGAWDEAKATASSWSKTASEVGHDLDDAARQAAKTADEVEDDLRNAAREAGKAANAASEAADEFKAALEDPTDTA